MSIVNDILSSKGSQVYRIAPSATVLDATDLMNSHQVGVLVVTESAAIVGIFSERDILRRVISRRLKPAQTMVSDVMTNPVICCSPDTPIDEAGAIFKNRRIRHLPIVNQTGELVGLISIGDVNAWTLKNHEADIQYLHEYLYGRK